MVVALTVVLTAGICTLKEAPRSACVGKLSSRVLNCALPRCVIVLVMLSFFLVELVTLTPTLIKALLIRVAVGALGGVLPE